MNERAQLSISTEDLATVDAAAKEAGESRSKFMVKSALMRAIKGEPAFTPKQLQAIRDIVLHELDGMGK